MQLQTIRKGSKGELVERLQAFLRGRTFYLGAVDGDFGPRTDAAVREWQRVNGLGVDGVVGNQTWGALMAAGLELVASDTDGKSSPNWPPRPDGLRPLSVAQRQQLFGSFTYEPAPTADNPEAIRITSRSAEFKLVEVSLPELVGVAGFPKSGRVLFEDSVAAQLRALVVAWQRAGLLDRIQSWAGSYVPRFVRGSRTSLSNHSWGTAFDINAAWNGLGARPALVGQRGSVRELVPLAVEHGFYWGGWFSRPDGMHFEACRIVTEPVRAELEPAEPGGEK